MHRRFGRVDRQPIHHLDRRRNDAVRDDRRTPRRRPVDRCRTPASSVCTASGRRSIRTRRLGDDGQRAFGADEHAEQIEAGRVERGAADLHQLAVRQHRLDAEHVVHGEAVLQAVRAAGVLGDVAADRADLLARRIGRVVAAERRDLPVISRLVTPGSTVTRWFGMSTSRTRLSRDSAMTHAAGTGSAPPDRPVPWPRATNGTPRVVQSRTIACTSAADAGQHDGGRRRAQVRQRVALVRQQLERDREDVRVAAQSAAVPRNAQQFACRTQVDLQVPSAVSRDL